MKKLCTWMLAVLMIIILVCGVACYGTRNDISKIMQEENYSIVQQEMIEISLLISKSNFSEAAYTSEGQTFSEDEIIVYQTDTTSIYLEKVMLSHEDDGQLYFLFDCGYNLPKDKNQCIIQVPFDKDTKKGYSSALSLINNILSDDEISYLDAVAIRGHGPSAKFAFYVSKEAVQKAVGSMKIDVNINQVKLEPKEYVNFHFIKK